MKDARSSSAITGRRTIPLIGWLVLSLSASGTAGFVSTSGWSTQLNKPPWNPPGWIFGSPARITWQAVFDFVC
jgi:tryptophan-rich sensory protein